MMIDSDFLTVCIGTDVNITVNEELEIQIGITCVAQISVKGVEQFNLVHMTEEAGFSSPR